MDIKFIGWCHNPTRNNDKVWGIADMGDGEYMTFWGRRGKKLQKNTKIMGARDAAKLMQQKRTKGYQEFDQDELGEIHENFRKQVFVIKLKG